MVPFIAASLPRQFFWGLPLLLSLRNLMFLVEKVKESTSDERL